MATHIKRPGPPVPPRPQHATATSPTATVAAAGFFKGQRESIVTLASGTAKTTWSPSVTQRQALHTTTSSSSSSSSIQLPANCDHMKITVSNKLPVIHPKKPAKSPDGIDVGRTIVYKSPSIGDPQRLEGAEQRGRPSANAAKPPLKLRKAPSIPMLRPPPRPVSLAKPDAEQYSDRNHIAAENSVSSGNVSKISLNVPNNNATPKPSVDKRPPQQAAGETNIVIVHSSSRGTGFNYDDCISAPPESTTSKIPSPSESDKVGANRIPLEQLQTGQPLPKPRKIVKMPVATMNMDEKTSKPPSLLRRSKTTLDSLASCTNITTINTGGVTTSGNNVTHGFLSSRTVEMKNNLKNAAERLFSEIIVNQQKHNSSAIIITKHEQHQTIPAQEQNMVTTPLPSKTIPDLKDLINSSEKKAAFHEILISEITAMRAKSSSMENLRAKDISLFRDTKDIKNAELSKNCEPSAIHIQKRQTSPVRKDQHQRCNFADENDLDSQDLDVDNVIDTEGDEEDLSKVSKPVIIHSPRRRCPSGCSSDSSPYGTERSTRIRTSDWTEVGDNGKQVTLTSCHISLEDSGLEDEERLDDVSSSGVGDSWDSVQETGNHKRSRDMKRAITFPDLPPLPKSLYGINKMLGSNFGLLSNSEHSNGDNNNSGSKQDNKIEWQSLSGKTEKTNTNNGKNCDRVISRIHSSSSSDDDNKENNNKPVLSDENGSSDNEQITTTETTTTTKLGVDTTASLKQPAYTMATIEGTLDLQLATLRKEMYGLRQLDLSLLSKLWALNDSLQEFRTMIEEQEQDDDAYLPHSPAPSSFDLVSSDDDGDANNSGKNKPRNTPKIITKQPKLSKSHSVIEQQRYDNRIEQQCGVALDIATAPQLSSKPLDLKSLPRMRTAPPPPPAHRKSAAPPRPK